jgi:hypothetical protein
MLGVPSLPSFLDLGPLPPRRPSSARWFEAWLIGLFVATASASPELVIDEAVSVVATDCTSIDFCRVGGVVLVRSDCTAFCAGLLLVSNCASSAYLLLFGCLLAADAKGKLVSCEPESSISWVPSPSSKVDKLRVRFCWNRGGRLNSWLRWAGWSVSDSDEELLEDEESGMPGETASSFRWLVGGAVAEGSRSSDLRLVRTGR